MIPAYVFCIVVRSSRAISIAIMRFKCVVVVVVFPSNISEMVRLRTASPNTFLL